MKRVAGIILCCGLTGCVAAGPTYTPQQIAAVRTAATQDEADARAHKISWVEAARRDEVKTREVGGATLTQGDELNFALRSALAAEVDAGRMTPEMARLKYQQHLTEVAAAQQARDDEQRQRIGEAMMIAGQSMQNAAAAARPVSCTSTKMGIYTNTTCN